MTQLQHLLAAACGSMSAMWFGLQHQVSPMDTMAPQSLLLQNVVLLWSAGHAATGGCAPLCRQQVHNGPPTEC
jgi:hypothetical protein